MKPKRVCGKPLDLGTSMLSPLFERASDLPKGMRRDAMEVGWPVDGPDAYPVVEHRDPDGVLRPLNARDIYLVATVASVLAAFMHRHGERLEQGLPVRGSEWYIDGHSEVWLTKPHDAKAGCDRERRVPTMALRMLQVPPRARKR